MLEAFFIENLSSYKNFEWNKVLLDTWTPFRRRNGTEFRCPILQNFLRIRRYGWRWDY